MRKPDCSGSIHPAGAVHLLALFLSLLAVVASYLVADRIYERVPHIEDEAAYLWQARVFAGGKLTLPTLENSKSFLVPFVVSYEGQRFSKYTPGWSLVLALGVKLGLTFWVNPLLAGLGVWLTYLLGKRYFGLPVGLLAAALTVPSPIFLMNSGSVLSHPLGLVLTAGFALAWLGMFASPILPPSPLGEGPGERSRTGGKIGEGGIGLALLAGLCLGMLVLTRPFTAVAVAVPFGLHGLYLLVRGDGSIRRRVLWVGLITLAFTLLYLGWTWAVAGDPLMNTYTLWWPYDKIGFGNGVGVLKNGHSLRQAIINTRQSLESGIFTLFGWGPLSWVFLPFGLWSLGVARYGEATWKRIRARGVRSVADTGVADTAVADAVPATSAPLIPGAAWLLMTIFPILVVFYMAYWIGSTLYGPRYYYEGLLSLTLLSGAGITYLAGSIARLTDTRAGVTHPHRGIAAGSRRFNAHLAARRIGARRIGARYIVPLLVTGLVAYNLVVYLPWRLESMHGLYGSNRQILKDFQNAREIDGTPLTLPALVIVHSEKWQFYGALMELQNPFLTTPVIFAWSMKPATDAALQRHFPDRRVYHYYETNPRVLYLHPSAMKPAAMKPAAVKPKEADTP